MANEISRLKIDGVEYIIDAEKLNGEYASSYLLSSGISDWAKEANKPTYTYAEVGAEPANANIQTHISDTTSNPHQVNADQVGLGETASPTFAGLNVGDGSPTWTINDSSDSLGFRNELATVRFEIKPTGLYFNDNPLGSGSVNSVSLESGTYDGTLKLTVNSTTTDNIAVTGLGSAAYTSSADYVAKNTAITGATKTKISYDAKGLVTAGADATLDDIGDGTTRKLSNYVPTTRKVNGHALSSDVTVTASDVGLGTGSSPTFAGLNVGEGSDTWTIDDTTEDVLTFKLGSTKIELDGSSGENKTIAFTDSDITGAAAKIATTQKSDNVDYQIPFVSGVTAENKSLYTDNTAGNIKYNPSTNALTTTTFVGALTGNADTATTLKNPVTISIGETGRSFNGSSDITWSLADIGAASASTLSSHIGDKDNPHEVTADQLYLGTDDTPTFAGIELGAGSDTWTITDATPDQLKFINSGTIILPKVSGTETIAFVSNIPGAETDPIFSAWNKSTGISILTSQISDITATVTEINKLDGFTGTYEDLNYAKALRATGVTATEFDKLDGVSGTIWHADNDGSGSGLDADLLDGKHASEWFTNPTFTGTTNIGSGSDTWTITDATANELQFTYSGAGTAILSKVDFGTTNTIAYNEEIEANYQPLDADLTAIAEISATSGLLKKTATNTWALDPNTYLTTITKTMVEDVLTGTITSHNHSGIYEPANANIQTHILSTSNPHNVTKAQLDLDTDDTPTFYGLNVGSGSDTWNITDMTAGQLKFIKGGTIILPENTDTLNPKTIAFTDNVPNVGSLTTNNNNTLSVPTTAESFTSNINLHKVSKTGSYSDLLNKPDLKAVAITGSYNDLLNKPTIPTTPEEIGLGTDSTPNFAGLSVGSGSDTWSIDDEALNALTFKLANIEKLKISGDGIYFNGNKIDSNATHTGDVTGSGALTITNNAVTNAKLATVATQTLKGRKTAGTGNVEDLTASEVRTILNVADGATNYTHPLLTRTDTTDTAAPGFGGTFDVVDTISSNEAGHITGVKTTTITIPTPTIPATNIGVTHNATSVSVTSSTGTDGTIEGATSSLAGVITNAAQSFGGLKSFNDNIAVGTGSSTWTISDAAADQLRFINGGTVILPKVASEETIAFVSNIPGAETDPVFTAWDKSTGISIASSQINDKTNSYNSSGTAVVTGTAVAAAIGTLDVAGASGITANRTINAWSETDGKVSITTQDISITTSQINDITATAAELNVLDGITATTQELNYTDGVTSNIQTQLNSKAPTENPIFTGTTTIGTGTPTWTIDDTTTTDTLTFKHDGINKATISNDGVITATTFNGNLTGNADTATKLGTTTIGSAQLPIYLNNGSPTAVTSIDASKLSGTIPAAVAQTEWDTAYTHSQKNDGSNPHGTTFANLASKPTTLSGFGITDALNSALKGAVNGLAELDENGRVPSTQLPSYVDDVLEYASLNNFPATGEAGKIYIAKDTNKTYRWGGSNYAEISSSLALGTTNSTAFRGDYGNTAYLHTALTNNPHSVTATQVGLGTASTPTFAGVNVGSGSPTWTISDSTPDQLKFINGGTSVLPKVNNGVTKHIAYSEDVQSAITLAADKAVISGSDGKLTTNSVTATEVGYLSGVTSAIQTQLDDKEPIIATKNTAFNKNYGTTSTDVKMNGTQAVGSIDAIARIDHVHPTDTTRVAANTAITAGTNTKITYDAKGLVTGGTSATLDDIGEGVTRKLSNYVLTSTKVNGHSLTGDVTVSAADVDLGNVTNESKTTMFTNPTFTGITTIGNGSPTWSIDDTTANVLTFKDGANTRLEIKSGGLYVNGSATALGSGTVTAVTGSGAITSSGGTTPAISITSGYTVPTSTEKGYYDSAYTHSTTTTGSVHGSTTVGGNLLRLANITTSDKFLRINYTNNSVSALTASEFRTAIGAGTSSTTGTVTSVGGTGTVSGITLSGTVNTTGNLTLGGSISGLTTSNLSASAGILNAQLANSSVTVGTTAISLGGSATTIAGLTSVTSTTFVGALTGTASGNLTSASTLNASKLSGTIPSAVLGNSTHYIGTTAVTLNRASATLALTGVTNTNWDAAYTHVSATNNPHSVTASQVGLGTTATPTFAGISIGAGSATWTIDDSVLNVLTFKDGANTRLEIKAGGLYVNGSSSALGSGTVTSVTATGAIASTGGTTPQISVASGYTIPTSTEKGNYDTAYTGVNTATNANTASTIVKRDASGNFSAGTITASLTGTASGNLTSASTLDASKLSGTIPSAVLGNSTHYIGTTAVTLNRASATLALTGVTNTNWDAAYTHSTTTTGAVHGATTVGNSFFRLTNPSAITFPRINADNTVTALSAADFRTAIGAGTSSTTGTVTSVGLTAGTGISISGGPITTSGSITVTNSAPNVTTNLSTTHNATTVIVNSSDGTDATINGATTTTAGVVTNAAQTFGGLKSFNNNIALGAGSQTWQITDSSSSLLFQAGTTPATRATLYNNGDLTITGKLSATSKSFLIDHPTKSGYKLQYGSLEGPENGVYVRGRLTNSNIIELPEYWKNLVDEDSITVTLTAIGKAQKLFVENIKNNKIYIKNSNRINKNINCFYVVYGERKDVDKLEVEMEAK